MSDAIVVDGLTKRFGKVTAVDDISFRVKKGEWFALLGPNGAGKTTTVDMLTTRHKPSFGKAFIKGFDVQKEQDKVRASIGVVFQGPSLDASLTARQNLEIIGALYGISGKRLREKTSEMLALVDLSGVKKSIGQFSGGMKRRVEIARALVHEPEILFLDEPTAGLDPHSRETIWRHLVNLRAKMGVTLVLTTHYLEEAEKYCDQIAIMDSGRIVRQGTLNELKQITYCANLSEAFLSLTGYNIWEGE